MTLGLLWLNFPIILPDGFTFSLVNLLHSEGERNGQDSLTPAHTSSSSSSSTAHLPTTLTLSLLPWKGGLPHMVLQHWASEDEFHIGGFVLRQLIEHQPNRLHECQQYKTAYVEVA